MEVRLVRGFLSLVWLSYSLVVIFFSVVTFFVSLFHESFQWQVHVDLNIQGLNFSFWIKSHIANLQISTSATCHSSCYCHKITYGSRSWKYEPRCQARLEFIRHRRAIPPLLFHNPVAQGESSDTNPAVTWFLWGLSVPKTKHDIPCVSFELSCVWPWANAIRTW